MASKHFSCYALLLSMAFLIHPIYSSEFPGAPAIYRRQPVERPSNTSFYGGVALYPTITIQAPVCPAGSEMCPGGFNTCCPQGASCQGIDDGYCCPLDVDCSVAVNAAPVCAESSWGLYEISVGSVREYMCCSQGSFGLESGGGCISDSQTASAPYYTAATSITQALSAPTSSAVITGSGSTTMTGSASPTATNGTASNRLPSSSTVAIIIAALFGLFA